MTQNGFTIHVPDRHLEWLREVTAKYAIRDEHKAMRIIFEYMMQEADEQTVFSEVRCAGC